MDPILSFLMKLIGPVVGILIGWLWGQWQSMQAWSKKEFTSSIVLSLNSVELYTSQEEDTPVGSLKLRTLFERELRDVYPNRAMEDIVRSAGKETRPGDPILRFAKEDAWYILNSILNQISEQFAVGTMRADMGLEVDKKWYTFCVTFEHEESLQQFKPRILLIERECLQNFPETGTFELESTYHTARVETLRKLKQEYTHNPYPFMDLEIAL